MIVREAGVKSIVTEETMVKVVEGKKTLQKQNRTTKITKTPRKEKRNLVKKCLVNENTGRKGKEVSLSEVIDKTDKARQQQIAI